MKNKFLKILIAMLVSALFLSGCATGDKNKDNKPAENEVNEQHDLNTQDRDTLDNDKDIDTPREDGGPDVDQNENREDITDNELDKDRNDDLERNNDDQKNQ